MAESHHPRSFELLTNRHPLIHWFINNTVSANLLMMGILLTGLYMVGFFGLFGQTAKIPLEAFPLTESNTITVTASLNGASPEDVESGVTHKIEEALQGIQGIARTTSTSTASLASIRIEAATNYDLNRLLDEVKNSVDSLKGLPTEVEKVLVSKNQRQHDILWVTLYGEVNELFLKKTANRLKTQLLKNPYVETVLIDGEKAAEIAIEIPESRLNEYALTLPQIATAINNASLDLALGNLETTQGKIALRLKNQSDNIDDYSNITIRTFADGSTVKLGDIATLTDGLVEQSIMNEFNGKPSLTLRLKSGENANVIEADQAVTQAVLQFTRTLPPALQTTIWNNRVDDVRDRIDLFTRNVATGIFLVFLLLTLFLNLKLAFWVALGIPVSFAGALLAMGLSGITINLITLFGFIIVLGIVVDDAIIIGESIYSWKKQTHNAPQATLYGAARVSTAATFGVLTTVAAFLPLTQVDGRLGEILGQVGWVVIFCLLFSLLESKLILPAHLKATRVSLEGQISKNPWIKIQTAVAQGLEHLVEKTYLPVLSMALRHRYFTLLVFISAFILSLGTVLGGILKVSRFPHIESQSIALTVQMEQTVDVATTQAFARQAAKALRKTDQQLMQQADSSIPNITHIASFNTDDTTFMVRAGLASAETRSLDAQTIVERWRENVGPMVGAKSINYASRRRFTNADIEVHLLTDNPADQVTVQEKIIKHLARFDGIKEITSSEEEVSQEIHIHLKPEAKSYGVTHAQLARSIRAAFYGLEAERIQRGTDEIRVMLRYPRDERQSLANLTRLHLHTDSGLSLPIETVADLSFAYSPKTIRHLDGKRIVTISANVDRRLTRSDAVIENLRTEGFLTQLEQQYQVDIRLGGEAEEGEKTDASMTLGFIISLIMIYILLAIPLKSYGKPLIIMSVIPFGIIGAIIGHLLLGMDISMIGIFGIIALSGVVVNDSLLLLSTIQQNRDAGLSLYEAVQVTGVKRFRPVILTSLTTFAGLMPMLFETSFQAQFLIPMAVSLGFGILFATCITLILIPVLYFISDDINGLFFIKTP